MLEFLALSVLYFFTTYKYCKKFRVISLAALMLAVWESYQMWVNSHEAFIGNISGHGRAERGENRGRRPREIQSFFNMWSCQQPTWDASARCVLLPYYSSSHVGRLLSWTNNETLKLLHFHSDKCICRIHLFYHHWKYMKIYFEFWQTWK